MATIQFSEEDRQNACNQCRKAMDSNDVEEIADTMNDVCELCKIVMQLNPALKQSLEDIRAARSKLAHS
ncbi:hypothetical protein BOW53_11900 [Solemya pervernicosa gill symbiont]|uniref:Uncharacterized protein n=2 Tax=Gammaproteobacteria incertae sedis TaxID=118884 RepID=A0A1T2L2Q2_9GAMM|nr:hypothetical protein [Candidatus Reidiella endopervernicosa]OOZ39352.1 hypothetical protein BOW53_11900 [Solemya pervernicosa gill symbiont]QKQ26512.1 hypothetical protein HUE57_09645 [Candidatus Reidiella endopervernicosa]